MTGYITAGELEDNIVEEIIEIDRALEVIKMYDPIEYMKELGGPSPINKKLLGENLSEYQKNLLKIARINSRMRCLHELYKQHFPERAYETFKEESIERYIYETDEDVDRQIKSLGKLFPLLFRDDLSEDYIYEERTSKLIDELRNKLNPSNL